MAGSSFVARKTLAIRKAFVEHRFFKTVWMFFFDKIPKLIKANWKKYWLKVDKALARPAIRSLEKNTPIDPNAIIFITSTGRYDCNPKWICEEIIRQKLPYKLYWVVRKLPKFGNGQFPLELNLIKRDSYEFHQACASAKVIIDNSTSMAYMQHKKKPGQYLIETWHGAIGIKKFSKDTNNDKEWLKKAEEESAATDFCISNSTFETDLFRDTFWANSEILEYGHARNDILFPNYREKAEAAKQAIYEQYMLEPETRICMYAPTFRDDNDATPYLIDYKKLLEALKTRFGGEWVIFTRYHRLITKKMKSMKLPENVINVSNYPDIQELMYCTDVGITDYSSWICEYLLTGRPGFLYATDADTFVHNERALFYPLSSMPFPLAKNNLQLIENVLNFDQEKFEKECPAFLKKYGCIDDGHASERAVEKIKELMSK